MHNIAITTECVADLPKELLEKKHIDIIYFDVETETGIFRDTDEIDAQNIIEYMLGVEKKAQSIVPAANDYKNFFKRRLEEYDEVIHISISSGVSSAYKNAELGRAKLGINGRKIHLVDSGHLSSGLGLLVLKAGEYRDKGMDSNAIVEKLNKDINRIFTSFIVNNVDYLYYNNQVGKYAMKLCKLLHLHPVLHVEEGKLVVKRFYLGNYKNATSHYISDVLRRTDRIDTSIGFCTYVGCSHAMLERIKGEVEKKMVFEQYWEQAASVTISCNCGPKTFGILFQKK
ncbi:MAG: DegV family protein [Lachnospiraceae bacterium]